MTSTCNRSFAEELFTGYIDGILTQGDRQRIDVHVEGCDSCSSLLDGLVEVRTAARTTAFAVPSDTMWRESARSLPSRWFRQIGWLLVILWTVGVSSLMAYELATSSEAWWIKTLVFAVLSGIGFLFISVLMDRLHDLGQDRYRSVQK